MNIRVNKRMLLYIMLLFPMFKPIGPTYYMYFNRFFQIWKIISICCLMALLVKSKGVKRKNNKGENGLIIFWAIYVCNCIINRVDIQEIINNALTSCLLLFLTHYSVQKKEQLILLNTVRNIFILYIVFQTLSVIIIKLGGIVLFQPLEGDYIYFLGTDNYSAFAIFQC